VCPVGPRTAAAPATAHPRRDSPSYGNSSSYRTFVQEPLPVQDQPTHRTLVREPLPYGTNPTPGNSPRTEVPPRTEPTSRTAPVAHTGAAACTGSGASGRCRLTRADPHPPRSYPHLAARPAPHLGTPLEPRHHLQQVSGALSPEGGGDPASAAHSRTRAALVREQPFGRAPGQRKGTDGRHAGAASAARACALTSGWRSPGWRGPGWRGLGWWGRGKVQGTPYTQDARPGETGAGMTHAAPATRRRGRSRRRQRLSPPTPETQRPGLGRRHQRPGGTAGAEGVGDPAALEAGKVRKPVRNRPPPAGAEQHRKGEQRPERTAPEKDGVRRDRVRSWGGSRRGRGPRPWCAGPRRGRAPRPPPASGPAPPRRRAASRCARGSG
jgi:hypothetical protein